MGEVRAITTWFTQPEWNTAHEVRENGLETACGRWIGDQFVQAPEDMRRCGQCVRRRP